MVTIQDPKTVHPRTSNFDSRRLFLPSIHVLRDAQGPFQSFKLLAFDVAGDAEIRRSQDQLLCSTVMQQACHQALKNDLYISVYIIPNVHSIAQNELQVFGMAYHGFSLFSSSS